jgi:fructokinase
MRERQYDLIAIGEVLIDLISNEMVPALHQAEGFRRFLGGEVSNVAWNVSALGGHAAVIACVGDDGFGDYLRDQMASAGICTDCLRVTSEAPTSVAVNARQTKTPDFIIYRGADAQISLDDVDLETIKRSRVVHTSAFALSREPARSTILQAFESARENGCLTSLDPNYHPRIWPDVADFRGVLEEAYGLVDITKPSLDDCHRLLGAGRTPVDYVEYFLDLGPRVVALTMGSDGVLLATVDGELSHVRPSDIAVADVTGAGDAFWGGLLVALIDGRSPDEAACLGQMVAEAKIGTVGPMSKMPDRARLYQKLETFKREAIVEPPSAWWSD